MTFPFQNDPIWSWPILTRYGFSMKLFCKLLPMFNVLIISMLVFECVRKNSLFEFLKNSIKCFSLPLLLFLVNWFSCKIRQYNSNKPPFRSPPTCLGLCPCTWGFMPANMSTDARGHEHGCPRTWVLLTDDFGHKCPKPWAKLGKASGEFAW